MRRAVLHLPPAHVGAVDHEHVLLCHAFRMGSSCACGTWFSRPRAWNGRCLSLPPASGWLRRTCCLVAASPRLTVERGVGPMLNLVGGRLGGCAAKSCFQYRHMYMHTAAKSCFIITKIPMRKRCKGEPPSGRVEEVGEDENPWCPSRFRSVVQHCGCASRSRVHIHSTQRPQ